MKKAISPVIATVIIVAVTIAIAIAVALWMTGLVGSFTGTENLQIVSAYATKGSGNIWTIHLEVKNVGTVDVTIDNIFINGVPVSALTTNVESISISTGTIELNNINIPIKTGETVKIYIYVQGYTPGQMLEIKLHSAAGKEYPKQVTLP
ncbi:archaellin/type IV pilin N-terminal domain-containing protein [Desulfurococcus amylolyticus]|uniref:Archaeal flagellin-like protein n=1 Tax=Desulfurococcus amylolyticus DSM 16532 TaxID=768672 RepID=I3XRG0_DESAM|nr:archaellin/type IV pilin N-terminal domain-containing protein [Desulfurococcus amylolyticus]AFL66534.1 archaeal flagellin-like protein [Desulfurococcus amylolyticus DSM 16532]